MVRDLIVRAMRPVWFRGKYRLLNRLLPGDVDAVAAALKLLVTDPVTRLGLGLGGPVRAWELCDPARQVQRIAGVLGAGVAA